MIASTSSIERRKHDDVADEAAHDTEPCRGLRGLGAADGARRFDQFVVCHAALLSFTVPHPGNTTAAAELHQPGARAAAVDQFEPARALPPTLSSQGASTLAEAFNDASAFSSEIPDDIRACQAVAVVGSASTAAAKRILRNAATLRVVAESLMAFNAASNSISVEA